MSGRPYGTIVDYLSADIRLQADTSALARQYSEAKPYPFLVLQNLFESGWLDDLVKEIGSVVKEGWVVHNDAKLSKANLRSAVDLGVSGRRHVALLHSAAFLYMLSEITGIWGLVPDPYLAGGGYHVLSTGGLFDVHADRNVDHNTGLTRRIALITYLNHEWEQSYGGQLELWSTDATRCEYVVEPGFNTTILFEVGDRNFHGVRPVQPAQGMSRKSFAAYFHTVGDSESGLHSGHHSVYAPSVYRRPLTLKRFANDYVLPPGFIKGWQRIRDKVKDGGGPRKLYP